MIDPRVHSQPLRQEVSELPPTLHELVQLQVEVVEVAVASWKMLPNGSVEREHLACDKKSAEAAARDLSCANSS